MIDYMFEGVGAVELLDVMRDAQRAERRATARRLLATGRFTQQRLAAAADAHNTWCVDDWEATATEIGAELGYSRQRASTHMSQAISLLERLPTLAEVFAAGAVDHRIITAIIYRTDLLTDKAALAAVDALLAEQAPHWNTRSRDRVAELVDWIVIQHDPDAVRIATQHDIDRHIGFDPGPHGMTQVYGDIRATAAAALDTRLDAMAATVCRNDPRTTTQRRADAIEYLADGALTLPCLCHTTHCPTGLDEAEPAQAAPSTPNQPTRRDVIHLIPAPETRKNADTDTDAAADEPPATPAASPASPQPRTASLSAPPRRRTALHVYADPATLHATNTTPALLAGYGALPADMVRDLATRATIRALEHPNDLAAEDHHRPSQALADYIRARDLTCRYPGCNHPAEHCDIDHTIPWPTGPTHPSNLKLLCRTHHLLKTFYTGPNGWTEQQLPDATITWTSPAGRTYTTTPAGALYHPQLAQSTGDLPPPRKSTGNTTPDPHRGLAMPTRPRTRAQDRAYRITRERAHNHAHHKANPPPF